MSAKVFLKIVSRVASSSFGSHSCFHSVGLSSIGNSAKFIEPMLSEHISGSARSGAASRSSSVISDEPPVVMLITASVACLMRGRNCMNTSGSAVGRPFSGSRAWRCRIDAPASAAAIASAAIWSGVTGR